jgi:tetratricopeptide (TPR) repeat protein
MASLTDITPDALVRTAQLHEQQGRLGDAITAYQELLRRWPDRPASWYNLGVLLRKARQFPAALACYQQAIARGISQPEEVHLNCGVVLSDYLHQYDAAEQELKRALAANPTYVPALLNLANLQEDLGRRAAALATYENILRIEPHNALALGRYANTTVFTKIDDPLVGRLQQELANPRAGAADRALLGFALGRALDSCGDYAAAFAAYESANRFSRASVPAEVSRYDRKAWEQFIDRIIAAFPTSVTPVTTATPKQQVAFICGMFRSGSTLIEQLLAADPRFTSAGELDVLPHLVGQQLAGFPESVASRSAGQLARLANDYYRSLAQSFPNAGWITDKRPDNYLYIGLIKQLFPDARIVHTTRDPLDNCLSIFFLHLDPSLSYALDLSDIGHHYRQYARLMRHWKTLYGTDIIDVNYDTYVHDVATEARKLFGSLGLDWRGQTRPQGGAVRTASVWQVREPIYQRSSGRAHNYTRQVSVLREEMQATS